MFVQFLYCFCNYWKKCPKLKLRQIKSILNNNNRHFHVGIKVKFKDKWERRREKITQQNGNNNRDYNLL